VTRRLGRLGMVAGLVAVWVLLIAARLYHLQVSRYEHYTGKAERQQQRVVTLDPPRGTIYDAHGRELAVSVQVDSVYAVPPELRDRAAAARALAAVVPGVNAAKLARQLAGDREFIWVARKLDPPVAAKVRELGLPGMGSLAAQVLGYVGTDNHGLAGLELVYDKEVSGKQGVRTVLRDAKRGTVISPDLSFAEPEPGHDLYLTLDATVQHIVERELVRAVEERGAKRGSVIFLDPRTGGVLAMASYPSFDPNDFGHYHETEWRNRAIMDVYEPGSTFKIVTAAAALDSGLIKADDVFDCEMGGITLFGIRIRDHKSYGRLSFADVIAKSSNVGVIKAALRLGDQRLYHTIREFGFGRLTGIDLPGESGGILHPVERWGPLAKAYIAFGQGISVTPLQLAVATGAVANGGTLLKPHVVAAVSQGEVRVPRYPEPPVAGHPISAPTAVELSRLLEGVVTAGTGKSAAIAGYRVAGKTGTAQIPVRGGYLRGGYLPSFVGYAPAGRAALVGVVAIAEPQGGEYYGGQVAAPVFGSIARQVLLYLGVHPERAPMAVWPGQAAPPGFGIQTAALHATTTGVPNEEPADGDDHAADAVPDPVLWRGPVPASVPAPLPPSSSSGGGGHDAPL
jgi:cell division protein FtsI (penicillin-binding protein 3)